MHSLNYLIVSLSVWSSQALVVHQARDSMACRVETGQDWGGPVSYLGEFYTGDTNDFPNGEWAGISTIRITPADYADGRTAACDFYVDFLGVDCIGAKQTIQVDGSQHNFDAPVNDNILCATCYVVNDNGH